MVATRGRTAGARLTAWSGASRIGLARSSHISESCEPWYPLSNVAIAPSSADTAGASALARPKRVWAAEARSTTTGPRADGTATPIGFWQNGATICGDCASTRPTRPCWAIVSR